MLNLTKIKEKISKEEVFLFLENIGAEPYYEGDNIIRAKTLCHNHINSDASHKLYYYDNTDSGFSSYFKCYTSCDTMDIFDFIQHYLEENHEIEADFDTCVHFFIEHTNHFLDTNSVDLREIKSTPKKYIKPKLHFNNKEILDNFHTYLVEDWEEEGIDCNTQEKFNIKFNLTNYSIIIPVFDKEGELLEVRERYLITDDIEKFGKYRPLYFQGKKYSMPSSFYLYGLNITKEKIKESKQAIVFEGEKSVMKYQKNSCSSFGMNFSKHHYHLLVDDLGVEEIVIAFDKQFKTVGDEDYQALMKKFLKISRYNPSNIKFSFIIDEYDLLRYKDSPIDQGSRKMNILLDRRKTIDELNFNRENEKLTQNFFSVYDF